jgi:23S rRNA (cytidine1920-2'-O)/16S rRNA (cytidine1409-2'-O)-methyltransferase
VERGEALPYVRGGGSAGKGLRVFPCRLGKCVSIAALTRAGSGCIAVKRGKGKRWTSVTAVAWSSERPRSCAWSAPLSARSAANRSRDAGYGGDGSEFISLRLVLQPVFSLLREGGEVLCLVKPQFEQA